MCCNYIFSFLIPFFFMWKQLKTHSFPSFIIIITVLKTYKKYTDQSMKRVRFVLDERPQNDSLVVGSPVPSQFSEQDPTATEPNHWRAVI